MFSNFHQVNDVYVVFCMCLVAFTQVGLFLGTRMRNRKVLVTTITLVPAFLAAVGLFMANEYERFACNKEWCNPDTAPTSGNIAGWTILTALVILILACVWWKNTTRVLSGEEPDFD